MRVRLTLLLLALTLLALLLGRFGETAVRGKSAALPLAASLTAAQTAAQRLALANPQVQTLTSGQRSEVMSVGAVGQQVTAASAACAQSECYQVNIYNFDSDSTVSAIVDVAAQTVRDVLYQPGLQPGINQRLAERALAIAQSHPDVIAALGYVPQQADMAPVAGGVRNSVCSQGHLCAIPTFRKGNEMLWAVIDLTTESLLLLNWTQIEDDGRSVPFVYNEDCPAPGSVSRDGWEIGYEVTRSDGLRVFNGRYAGRDALTSAKLVEWHVDYNGTHVVSGFEDVTGCGGGGGGFFVYPFGETEVRDLLVGGSVVGFEIVQDFRMARWGDPCNYRYDQHMQFFDDGRFRIVSGAYGRGCGIHPVYRPVVRIDLATDGDANDSVALWNGRFWQPQPTEFYQTPDQHQFTAEGYVMWVMDQVSGAGFYVQPGRGQFGDGGRGDEPFIYVTQHRSSEGDADMPIFGGLCCEDDYQQGPHAYVNNEAIVDENIVLWYVAQQQTDGLTDDGDGIYCWTEVGEPNPVTQPCFSGPMFVPFGADFATHDVTADFIVAPTELVFPQTAVFTNTSAINGNIPVNYLWDFGDGVASDKANPQHGYVRNGSFTPRLTVDAFVWGQATAVGPAISVSGARTSFLPLIWRQE